MKRAIVRVIDFYCSHSAISTQNAWLGVCRLRIVFHFVHCNLPGSQPSNCPSQKRKQKAANAKKMLRFLLFTMSRMHITRCECSLTNFHAITNQILPPRAQKAIPAAGTVADDVTMHEVRLTHFRISIENCFVLSRGISVVSIRHLAWLDNWTGQRQCRVCLAQFRAPHLSIHQRNFRKVERHNTWSAQIYIITTCTRSTPSHSCTVYGRINSHGPGQRWTDCKCVLCVSRETELEFEIQIYGK